MKYRKLLIILVLIALPSTGLIVLGQMHNRQDLNAFMKEHYGKFDTENKCWVKDDEDLHYVVCASQDIEINGEPHSMIAVCGEVPDDLKSHAACGYVDLYVMKRSYERNLLFLVVRFCFQLSFRTKFGKSSKTHLFFSVR